MKARSSITKWFDTRIIREAGAVAIADCYGRVVAVADAWYERQGDWYWLRVVPLTHAQGRRP